jgi:hypothetical protein
VLVRSALWGAKAAGSRLHAKHEAGERYSKIASEGTDWTANLLFAKHVQESIGLFDSRTRSVEVDVTGD